MGKTMEIIFKALQTGAEGTATLLDALLVGPAELPRRPGRMKYEPVSFRNDWAEMYKKRQVFYSLLNQLKRDGLVKKSGPRKRTLWSLTKKGREHLTKMWLRRSRAEKSAATEPMLPNKKYGTKKSKSFVIVAFDIPERARKRRDWLRRHLLSFGFKKLQKSVLAGNCGVPEEFLRDLGALDMLSWVHIFSVTKRGTLTKVNLK